MNAHNEQQPAAAQEAVAWSKMKPTAEGDYYVRGFNLFAPKQYEALVQVRMHHFDGEPAPELVCNLHESTSSEDMDDWSPIVEMSDDFEWRGPLFAAHVTAEPVIDLRELAELLRIWQCNFDSGVRPDEEVEPEDAALWDRIDRIRQQADASPKGGSEARSWKLLSAGEVIQRGDQILNDDCATWGELVGWEVGLPYNPALHVPMRRSQAQAGDAEVQP